MENLNFTGIYSGLFTFFTIAIGFVWVIKLEYYIGACIKNFIILIGVLLMLSTYFFVNSFFLSAFIGMIAGSIVWGGTEMQDQEDRALDGQFPVKTKKYCLEVKIKSKNK